MKPAAVETTPDPLVQWLCARRDQALDAARAQLARPLTGDVWRDGLRETATLGRLFDAEAAQRALDLLAQLKGGDA